MATPRHMALAFGVLANLLGGASYMASKLALTGFSPGAMLVLRTLIAAPLLLACSPRGWHRSATRADWIRMGIVGVFGMALPHLVGVYGLRDTDSLNGALLIGVEPITIVLLSALLLGERITRGQLVGIISAIAGGLLVVSRGDLSALAIDPSTRGNLLLLLSGVLWALYTVLAKPTLARVHPVGVTSATSLVSLLVLVPVALIELPQLDLARALAPLPIVMVIVLGLFVSFGATLLWNVSLKDINATQMAALVFLQPLTGTVLGVLAGEPLSLPTIIGGLLIFAGVYFSNLSSEKSG